MANAVSLKGLGSFRAKKGGVCFEGAYATKNLAPRLPRATFVLYKVGNFRQKNNSSEDRIDGTNGYFRRNSGCSAEQKISEFRSEPFCRRENNSEFRSVEQK
jgi:hypothetical protein